MASKMKDTIVTFVLCLIIAVVGFVVVHAMNTTTTSVTLYPVNAPLSTMGGDSYFGMNTTTTGFAEWNGTVDSAAAGLVPWTNDTVKNCSSLNALIYELPAQTVTFNLSCVANVTNKATAVFTLATMYSNGTLKHLLGTFETGLIADANQTLTVSGAVNHTFVASTDVIVVATALNKTDATALHVDFYFESTVLKTFMTLTYNDYVMSSMLNMIVSIAWVVIFAAIAIAVLIKGLGKGE